MDGFSDKAAHLLPPLFFGDELAAKIEDAAHTVKECIITSTQQTDVNTPSENLSMF